MTVLGYYPGCSLHGGGRELDLSVRELVRLAGAQLREIADWNCCGATSAHCMNHDLAVALPFRVLALAKEQGLTRVLAPCAACFSRLKGTNVRLANDPALATKMKDITGHDYAGGVEVISCVELANLLLAEGLAGKFTAPLKDLKVAPYYGCLLSRGQDIVTDDAENPVAMEPAIQAAGCQIVPWNLANECCGGGFSMSLKDAVVDLSAAILDEARAAGAEAIVTGCPMCHSNLDMRQLAIRDAGRSAGDLPVLYLSELLCLAAGADPKAIGLDAHFIDAMPLAARSQP
ncbi:MAG: CoB--CoM heterodisulfide reductase iron-sulfur subunit B family protein [Planctomycetota bacterium]|nr:CoB--CoM heterodisulfide reductase iron-sulfur subunit B family protein [Planctomycetota bacterium]